MTWLACSGFFLAVTSYKAQRKRRNKRKSCLPVFSSKIWTARCSSFSCFYHQPQPSPAKQERQFGGKVFFSLVTTFIHPLNPTGPAKALVFLLFCFVLFFFFFAKSNSLDIYFLQWRKRMHPQKRMNKSAQGEKNCCVNQAKSWQKRLVSEFIWVSCFNTIN